MPTRIDFWKALLAKWNLVLTPWRQEFFEYWANHEGMPFDKTWNPLATTWLSADTALNLGYNIGYGGGNWNSVPVRVYATFDDGVLATFRTLSLDYYVNLRKSITEQRINVNVIGPKDFTSWVGSDAYGRDVYNHMLAWEVSNNPVVITPPVGDSLDTALQKRFAVAQYAANLQSRAWGSNYDDVVSLYEQLKKFF